MYLLEVNARGRAAVPGARIRHHRVSMCHPQGRRGGIDGDGRRARAAQVAAHIKAVTARNNICVSLSFHTTGREILHVCQVSPICSHPDRLMNSLMNRHLAIIIVSCAQLIDTPALEK
jgi:hypothetical protein